jgi:hypothetical protein
MKQSWLALFVDLKKMAFLNPEISGVIGLIILIFLWRKPKFILGLSFLFALGLTIWIWFTSSYENRNKNKKFQRYEDSKIESRAEKSVE